MLTTNLLRGETLQIGDITIIMIHPGQGKIGIEAPADVKIQQSARRLLQKRSAPSNNWWRRRQNRPGA